MQKGKPTPRKIAQPERDQVISTDDVAVLFGCSVQAVRDWRHQEIGPEYFRTPGGQVRYRLSVVEAWIESHSVRH